MNREKIDQLLLNQKFHKVNLSLKWLSEDIRNLNDAINKTTLSFKDFCKTYKQTK